MATNDEDSQRQIPYFEYSIINQIAHAHAKQLGKKLRVLVVFGEIKTTDDAYDIDLLEVVEGWAEGDRVAEFGKNGLLPLRGILRLWFLTPEEFEERPGTTAGEMYHWVQRLMERVRKGYEIVYEVPAGYARNVLEKTLPVSTLTAPSSGVLSMTDPFQLPVARK